jgi:sugar (pentulose or hexulose) kinase
MGVLSDGMAGVLAGWSCTVQMVTPEPRFDSEMRTWVGILPTPRGWIAESNVGDAGNAYRWLVETLLKDSKGYRQADELARTAPPGCDGAMAFLGPAPVSMARAGLRTGGFLFPTPLSFQEPTPAHLLRAALENVAFGVRANLETLEEVTGLVAEELRLGGGMSRSSVFAEILASVSNRPVLRSTRPEVSTIGALLAAAVAAGERASLEEAARSVQFPCQEVAPSPSLAAEYEEHYQRWRAAYDKLQEVE